MPTALATIEPSAVTVTPAVATAVVYLRVSSQGQLTGHNPEGYSIDGQRQACEHYALSLGAQVVREYVEPGRTATNTRRQALQQLLAELGEISPTYVIFYDLSRVAREESDAFWLLAQVKSHGAKLMSTREPVDDSPQGLLLFAIMAGVNAFRSRDDGEKVKMGLDRKHADGGSHGPARLGYLNARENVAGREVAVITVDPERAQLIQLAFDAFATGEHTLTTLTDLLEEAGLRTRPTPTRRARPLSRASLHRILRDDYYTGVVTRDGVKREGRHDALIDPTTFQQVQKLLDAHRASGDRSHKHQHYLKGTIYCSCGRRLGYGRHRGKTGGIYEYFSCLSRVQRGGRCHAPYFPVDQTEAAIVRSYDSEALSPDLRQAIREAVLSYVHDKTEIARRESTRHQRRLRELIAEQRKLVQLHLKGAVDEEVVVAEQARIADERAQAQRWADAATREIEDVDAALTDALDLLDKEVVAYHLASTATRRLINQAIFNKLTIHDPDTITAERTPVSEAIAQLAHDLEQNQQTAGSRQTRSQAGDDESCAQDDHDPLFGGRGSYIKQMAEGEGFEPSSGESPESGFQDLKRSLAASGGLQRFQRFWSKLAPQCAPQPPGAHRSSRCAFVTALVEGPATTYAHVTDDALSRIM